MQPLIRRNLVPVVREMLAGFRLVVLGGARQTGKSTLVDELLGLPRSARFTLDDPGVRRLASSDPVGFLQALPRPSAIDEFQRAGPDLLLAVKQTADRDRTRGQLLLTGSSTPPRGRRRPSRPRLEPTSSTGYSKAANPESSPRCSRRASEAGGSTLISPMSYPARPCAPSPTSEGNSN